MVEALSQSHLLSRLTRVVVVPLFFIWEMVLKVVGLVVTVVLAVLVITLLCTGKIDTGH